MKLKLRNIVIIGTAIVLMITTAFAEKKAKDIKIQHAVTEADEFMRTLDDTMKDELVRAVLTENDEILLAKMLWGEDRANPTYMRAAVIWCVYNRIDVSHKSISDEVNRIIFPGYFPSNPVEQWAIDIVRDVTIRYVLEQNGFKDVGRVLPKEYRYYEQLEGYGYHTFKTTLSINDPDCVRWDWSLPSPYND